MPGSRIQETLAMQLKHIQEKGGVIRVPGTKTDESKGSLPIFPLLSDHLPHWLDEGFTPDPYFTRKKAGAGSTRCTCGSAFTGRCGTRVYGVCDTTTCGTPPARS